MGTISLLSRDDIDRLFGNEFEIIETNRSKPFGKQPPSKWFDEYLMVKK